MAYFPFFADLQGKPVWIIGNGPRAAEKAERLRPFGACLHRAERFTPALLDLRPVLVIAAEECRAANRRTAEACRAAGIPVNAVDDRDFCDFIFPSVLATRKLTVGISTGGASPTAAVMIRERLEEMLGDNIDAILDWLEGLRPRMAAEVTDPALRKTFWRRLFARALELDRPLTDAELDILFKEI